MIPLSAVQVTDNRLNYAKKIGEILGKVPDTKTTKLKNSC